MTITKEELTEKQMQEFIKILRNATPEGKNYIQITLVAAAQSIGETGFELPKCSRAEYKRHIKRLRQEQHTNPNPQVRELAATSIELVRTVCPIQ